MRLVAPITLAGLTALSVETSTKRSTPRRSAAAITFRQPITLFLTASSGAYSMSGTCLCAAAWITSWARYAQQLLDARRVADVDHLRVDPQLGVQVAQVAVEEVEVVLVDVGEHQPRRRVRGDLAAGLAADRARRARHQDAPAAHEAVELLVVEAHLVARQQVVGRQVGERLRRRRGRSGRRTRRAGSCSSA